MSASQPPPGADPSMEDILASIRRILSDEGEGEASVSPAAAPAGGARPHAGPADVAPAGDAAADVYALDMSMIVEEPAMPPVPSADPAPSVAEPVPGARHLVAPAAAAAAASSVGALVRTLVSEREQVAVHRGGPTIEDMVREELRPLLKAWLDTNLPVLVERLVRAEIERVVGRTTS